MLKGRAVELKQAHTRIGGLEFEGQMSSGENLRMDEVELPWSIHWISKLPDLHAKALRTNHRGADLAGRGEAPSAEFVFLTLAPATVCP